MSYPGITFVFMISVAIGSAIYYYFNREQNQHSAHGHRNDHYDYHPYVNISGPKSPSNTKKRRKESKHEDCTICLQAMKPLSIKILNCGHMFHAECIKKWFEVNARNSCPVCRRE